LATNLEYSWEFSERGKLWEFSGNSGQPWGKIVTKIVSPYVVVSVVQKCFKIEVYTAKT